MTSIKGTVRSLPNEVHGMHVHEYGDIRDRKKGMAAGGHYNPRNVSHGLPGERVLHEGDLGNIRANSKRVAKVDKKSRVARTYLIVGRGLIVHELNDKGTQPTGGSGARLAQCVLGIKNPDYEN